MKNKIINININDYRSNGDRIYIDIKKFFFKKKFLSETLFKNLLESHNWKQYKNTFIALNCSLNVVIPKWIYMILNVKLQPYAKKIVVGSMEDLEISIYKDNIDNIDTSIFYNKYVIINGCKNKYNVPNHVYIIIINKIIPFVRSIMYGNICNNITIYKKYKNG